MTPEEELELLEAQVDLKKLEVTFAEAQGRFQADPSEDNKAAYATTRDTFAAARTAFRARRAELAPPLAAPGDAVVTPEPVAATAGVKEEK